MQRIAVIGAGAAGLCAAQILSREKVFDTVIFEATNHIGGTWYYTDKTGKDEHGIPIHSSMYKNLRTNLPKQTMAFPTFAFDEDLPSFLKHSDVLHYLKTFALHFNIEDLIKFNTVVEDVQPNDLLPGSQWPKWTVTSRNVKSNEKISHIFDGVVICNGHYSVPRMPILPGQELFQGKVLHSHDYRNPEDFTNLNVVMLGGRSSGTDISLELCKTAKHVTMSHKGPFHVSELPGNLQQKPPVVRLTRNGVVFADETEAPCDVFLLCTGYEYSFPFLNKAKVVTCENNRVTPLYKHLIHIKYPNLSLVGICHTICPFPQFYCQLLLVVGVLTGRVKLPSEQEMLDDEHQDYCARIKSGLPPRHAHVMGPRQWAYNDELADLSGEDRIPERVRLLYDLCHHRRLFNLMEYKTDEFSLSDKGNYFRTSSNMPLSD